MIDLAVISGSGFYDLPVLKKRESVKVLTSFGTVDLEKGTMKGKEIAFLARHGKGHALLPHLINHRANLMALKKIGARAVISLTVCGVLKASLPLAQVVVFHDIFYPDNRLPDGQVCCIHEKAGDKDRAHYIFESPFSEELRNQIIDAADDPLRDGVYAYAHGPRFNSKAEIKMLQTYADFVSQTAGPEIILAGELEIPAALVGYGVDYANGVKKSPTPVEVLSKNLHDSKEVFTRLLTRMIDNFQIPDFNGFNYRF